MKAKFVFKGGSGSGNFGHSGRPGKRGGSGGGGGGGSGTPSKNITRKKVQTREITNHWDGGEGYARKGVPASVRDSMSWSQQKLIEDAQSSGKDVFTFGDSFYYKHGRSAETHEDTVVKRFANSGFKVIPIASGEHDAAFSGGAAYMSKKDSFFWTVATVERD